jgi:hypothetical protein
VTTKGTKDTKKGPQASSEEQNWQNETLLSKATQAEHRALQLQPRLDGFPVATKRAEIKYSGMKTQKAVSVNFETRPTSNGLNCDALHALLAEGWQVSSVNPSGTGAVLVIVEKNTE